MESSKIKSADIIRIQNNTAEKVPDLLAVEEPLEIRLGFGPVQSRNQKSLSVTMRTPGNDFELATGFLFTEGIIDSVDDIENIHYCESAKEEERGNVVRIELNPSVNIDWQKLQRNFYTTSSCGICGKSSIDAVRQQCNFINDKKLKLNSDLIFSLSEKLHGHQPVFTYTGGLHASALFDAEGNPLFVREDVGRHNALDKIIGAYLLSGSKEGKILMASGRAGFELVQKTVMAGFPVMVAVGAPSSLAVNLAQESGITLIGFAGKNRFNIYSGNERLNYET